MSERSSEPQAACPFVAFDDDRDHRGPGPDHRHRCFAESPAAPRALAHQAAYCLSASFPGCPTFLDWARREAAPVRQESPVRSLRDAPTPRGTAAAVAVGGAVVQPAPAAQPDTAEGGRIAPATGAATGPAGDEAAAAPAEAGPPEAAAAPAFLAGRPTRPAPAPVPADDEAWAPPRDAGPDDRSVAADDRPSETPRMPVGYAPVAPSRADRRPVAGGSGRSPREHRDPVAPSWEEPRHYESYPTLKSRGAGGIPRPLAYALIVLFAGVALFTVPFILQGLGGGGGEASPTPAPSASVEPTAEPSPTTEPTPGQVVYVVKAGDTLSKIAAQYGVTVDQILAANPQIKDANNIAVGDQIVIPQAAPSEIVDDTVTPVP